MADYGYPLPEERIALHPCHPRDACRLLVHGQGHVADGHIFTDLPSLLPPATLLVANDTRVINARLRIAKPTGGVIEIFCLEPYAPADYERAFAAQAECEWTCLVGNLKRWKQGPLTMQGQTPGGIPFTLQARYLGRAAGAAHRVAFAWTPAEVTFSEIVGGAGTIPIPPYLNRESQPGDTRDYQTVYSHTQGSVAAPTAGLHFTAPLMERIEALPGVDTRYVTLHVGAGTFQPVKSEELGGHPMHTEVVSVTRPLVQSLIDALQASRPVTAVGTTTVRTLESLPYLGRAAAQGRELHVHQWEAYDNPLQDTIAPLKALTALMDREATDSLTASTAILIAPGFRWRTVTHLLTNFHQPQSTLLLLVDSYLQAHGHAPGEWREIYRQALRGEYRFLSYGDAMLLTPRI